MGPTGEMFEWAHQGIDNYVRETWEGTISGRPHWREVVRRPQGRASMSQRVGKLSTNLKKGVEALGLV